MDRAAEHYLNIAGKIKAEAGVTKHTIRGNLSGRAAYSRIEAPEGRTPDQLYILAHECGHVAHGHFLAKLPKHVKELQAEQWAHATLGRHGVAVPPRQTERAKLYVARKIVQAQRRGAKNFNPDALAFAGPERIAKMRASYEDGCGPSRHPQAAKSATIIGAPDGAKKTS